MEVLVVFFFSFFLRIELMANSTKLDISFLWEKTERETEEDVFHWVFKKM